MCLFDVDVLPAFARFLVLFSCFLLCRNFTSRILRGKESDRMSTAAALLAAVSVALLVSMAASLASSSVVAVKSIAEVEAFLLPAIAGDVRGTLLVLDIDNTIFQAQQEKGHANTFYEHVKNGVHPVDAYDQWEREQENCPVVAVEDVTPGWIRQRQAEGVHVIGLTSRRITIAEATARQLSSIGVDLSVTAPLLAADEGDEQYALRRMYVSGVLYASIDKDKGAVLAEFLQYQPVQHRSVVMVDDLKKNIRSVDDAMHRAQVPFVGAFYPLVARHSASHPNSEM
jgi:hypothetical protein